ncbi:MAG: hypothetical protein GX477_10590 [Clostridiaceae bacterium]|jgi:Na+-transporting methylmalonyl-CoA/oxaloacetate decarboxylase gamma subunit|nr:hypothetical protein [Clostridiaceae bacterium]
MSFFESAIVGLVCMAVVFVVLAAFFTLIQVLSRILNTAAEKDKDNVKPAGTGTADTERVSAQRNGSVQAAQEQAAAARDPQISTSVQTSSLKLNNVDERTAAMIMAVVSHETGIPLNELVFRSISLSK